MTSERKLDKKVVVPGLALLALFVIGSEMSLSAQEARSTRSSSGTSAAPKVQSSSNSAPRATSSSSSSRSATARSSAGRGAVSTRQSTPANRGYRGSHGGGYYGRHNYSLRFGYGWGWGGYYGGYYYPYYYHPYYWGVPYYVPRRAHREVPLGAFDLNVRPKKAEVYLDGQFIGTAGKYDGFPEHLWLEEGSYELIFYRPGLATEKRMLTIYPGVVVDVRLQLQPGESVSPSELSSVDRTAGAMAEVRGAYRQQERAGEAPAPAAAGAELDTRAAPGRVRLSVLPADASVYLDGRLLGSGDELRKLHAGLVVEAGSHLIEVVRPGYSTERREFSVAGGDDVELEVLLEAG